MNSLNKRLDVIEEMINTTTNNDIVSKLKRIEERTKRDNVERMNLTYIQYLNDTIGTLEYNKKDFISILLCTIKYVRINNHNISRTLGVKPSCELENECIVHFISSIYVDMFDEEFIRSSSICLEKLLYPTNAEKTEIIPEELSEKKKSFKLFKK
jgi:hypothetical protein